MRAYDNQIDTDSTDESAPSEAELNRFKFSQRRSEKWGKFLMYTGYFLIMINSISVIMTMLNLLGFLRDQDMS